MNEIDTIRTRLLAENTKRTNQIASICIAAMGIAYGAIAGLAWAEVYSIGEVFCRWVLLGVAIICISVWPIAAALKYDHSVVKPLVLVTVTISSGVTYFLYPHSMMFILYGPIIISCMYYKRTTIHWTALVSCLIFMAAQVLNIYLEINNDVMVQHHAFLNIKIYQQPGELLKVNIIPRVIILIITTVICDTIARRGKELFVKQAEMLNSQSTMESDISAAAEMQHSALPAARFTTASGNLNVQAFMRAAKAVGGDFYDYFITDDILTFVVADVSDKGFPAAMFMMKAKNAVRTAFYAMDDFDQAISAVNTILCKDNCENIFVTMWIGSINIHTGVGKYANCGHNMPIVKHSNGTVTRVENDPDLILGVFEDAELKSHVLRLYPGDTMVLFTDGMSDEMNAKGESFGEERLVKALADMDKQTTDINEYLVREIDEFIGTENQFDDMTSLCICFKKSTVEEKKVMTVKASQMETERVLDEVNKMLYYANCPDEVRRNIDVAIDEICENIREYACEGPDETYDIVARVGDNYLELRYMDEGAPFNPLTDTQEPELNGLQIGGLGVYLYRTLMDDVTYEYSFGRNILKLVKVWNV